MRRAALPDVRPHCWCASWSLRAPFPSGRPCVVSFGSSMDPNARPVVSRSDVASVTVPTLGSAGAVEGPRGRARRGRAAAALGRPPPNVRKGEVVFHRGDPADSLHLVSKGRLKVQVMTPLGDEATIAIRGPGDRFGEMAVLGPARSARRRSRRSRPLRRSASARPSFVDSARSIAAIDRLLIEFLANEVRMLNERLLDALYVPVEKRLSAATGRARRDVRRLTKARW